MTTIVYRDGVIASDTQLSTSGRLSGHKTKIGSYKGKVLWGAAGTSSLCRAFADWCAQGFDIEEAPDMSMMVGNEHCSAAGYIFVGRDLVISCEPDGWNYWRTPFFSCGSGSDFALGALEQGATAEEAVKVAMQHDLYSGGKVEVLKLDNPDFNIFEFSRSNK